MVAVFSDFITRSVTLPPLPLQPDRLKKAIGINIASKYANIFFISFPPQKAKNYSFTPDSITDSIINFWNNPNTIKIGSNAKTEPAITTWDSAWMPALYFAKDTVNGYQSRIWVKSNGPK